MTFQRYPPGYVSVAVLVGLILVGMVAGALLKVGVARRNQLQAEEFALQADWLVEAGIERAAAHLNSDAAFDGETWEIPAEELSGRPGMVRIKVEVTEPSRRHVRIEAEYPSEGDRKIKRSKHILITTGPDQAATGDDS